jgi:hypothetical protein
MPIDFIQNFVVSGELPNLVPNKEEMLSFVGLVQRPAGPSGLTSMISGLYHRYLGHEEVLL